MLLLWVAQLPLPPNSELSARWGPPHPRSVMLWRRSDNVVFALLLGGADLVAVGDGVECKVKGILQVGRPAGVPGLGAGGCLKPPRTCESTQQTALCSSA